MATSSRSERRAESSRIMRLFFSCVLAAFLLLAACGLAQSQSGPPSPIPPALVNLLAVIKQAYASAASAHIEGRGNARVFIMHELARDETVAPRVRAEQYSVHFMFKGEKSRTDSYALVDGQRGELERKDADTGETACGYIAGTNGFVTWGGTKKGSHRKLAEDFHPATYDRIQGIEVPGFLYTLFSHSPMPVSFDVKEDGLLHIEATGPASSAHKLPSTILIVLDPERSYRLISYLVLEHFEEDQGRVIQEQCKVFYAHPGDSYPSRVESEAATTIVGSRRGLDTWPAISRTRVELNVDDFYQKAGVSDESFTLDGLQIPRGTEVVDITAPHPTRSYRYQVDPKDDEERLRMMGRANIAMMVHARPIWSWWALIGGSIVAVGVILLLVRRRFLSKARKV